ncbi:DUF2752 domain-containing protein [Alkalitalea saponilacus]|uniref:DUF2752 domain-containing protein n=1 Tax=Alkalitalea saponilacus TaxID=889453 RepID=UPI0012F861A1
MAAGLDRFCVLERDGFLTITGKIIYFLIVVLCSATLLYPFISCSGEYGISCLFRTLTGFPCPTCGYSRAVCNALAGNYGNSFMLNPLWLILIIYQFFLISISVISLLKNRMFFISSRIVIIFVVILGANWLLMLVLGFAAADGL